MIFMNLVVGRGLILPTRGLIGPFTIQGGNGIEHNNDKAEARIPALPEPCQYGGGDLHALPITSNSFQRIKRIKLIQIRSIRLIR